MGTIYKRGRIYSGGDNSVELTQAEYDALSEAEKTNGTVYFITDAGGSGGGSTASLPAGGATGQALIKRSDADGDVEWNTPSGTNVLSVEIGLTREIGGVPANRSYPAGTPLEDILIELVSAENTPRFIEPSLTYGHNAREMYEYGETANFSITVIPGRGSIIPAYGTDGFRAGAFQYWGTSESAAQYTDRTQSFVFTAPVSLRIFARFAQGEQPKTRDGYYYSTPWGPADVYAADNLEIKFGYPIYYKAANNQEQKGPLVPVEGGVYELSCGVHQPNGGTPSYFDVYAGLPVKSVMMYNTLSGQYDLDFLSRTTKTQVTHTNPAGDTILYDRYTDARDANAGAKQLRVEIGY